MTASIHLGVSDSVRGEKGTERGEIGGKAPRRRLPFFQQYTLSLETLSPIIAAAANSEKKKKTSSGGGLDVFFTLVLIICLTQQSLTSARLI